MRDKFIEIILNKINEYYTCYNEEAPSSASFPYLVVPNFQFVPNEECSFISYFDIEVYINELSDISFENIVDVLRDNLDGYFYHDKNISFHLGFDKDINMKSNEQDLIIRSITFSARIFR